MSDVLKDPLQPMAELLGKLYPNLPPFTTTDITIVEDDKDTPRVEIKSGEKTYGLRIGRGTLGVLFNEVALPDSLPEGVVGFYRLNGEYFLVVLPEMTVEESLALTGYKFDLSLVDITEYEDGTGYIDIRYPCFTGKINFSNAKEEEVVTEEIEQQETQDVTEQQDVQDQSEQQPPAEQPAQEQQQQQFHKQGKNKHQNRR